VICGAAEVSELSEVFVGFGAAEICVVLGAIVSVAGALGEAVICALNKDMFRAK